MNSYQHQLDRAANEALERYQLGMQSEFPSTFIAKIANSESFGARVFEDGDSFVIEVSKSVLVGIEQLWKQCLQSTILIDDKGKRIKAADGSKLTLMRLSHLSLTWLVLHEMMHIRLGHLDVLESANLVEMEQSKNSSSDQITSALRDALSKKEQKLVRPCLELQADNEATEMMLGVYAESEWSRFRIEAAAIFVVMALMEKADFRSDNQGKIYPLVATRFFTMFAQLFQYWLYPGAELSAGKEESFVNTPRQPVGEEFHRYMKFVLAHTINDVVQIALWAEAKNFLIDLGEGSALFKDIFEVQYAKDLSRAKLNTNAAREWRILLPVNEKIMAVTGLRR